MHKAGPYDLVIIGAGLGGLLCGAIMSKEGLKVCLLEKNEQIGGGLQTFRRDSVSLDTGIHYIGSLGRGQILYEVLNYLGIMERLELTRLDDQGYDVILFKDDDQQYPHGMGYDNFIDILSLKFPHEKEAITRYCKEIRSTCKTFMLYNLSAEDRYDDIDLISQNAKTRIASFTQDKKLRAVLAGSNMLYAGDADHTPWYVHALIINSFIESSWRCTRGGEQLAKLLAREIRANGGEIHTKSVVTSITGENGFAEYAVLGDGQKVYGKSFISDIHPAMTIDMIDSPLIRPAYKHRIKGLSNSVSAFVLNLILKPGTCKYTNRNYYYFDDSDVWDALHYTADDWPRTFGIFESVPEGNSPYTESISIMTYMRWDEVAPWQQTVNTSTNQSYRGEAYETFKMEKAEKLLAKVSLKFPDLVKNIETYYASTPLTYRDYLATPQGSIYGIVQDCTNPVQAQISPNTKVPNLYLTGQNIKLHGVLGVTISSLVTCSSILGKGYLINKIIKANEA